MDSDASRGQSSDLLAEVDVTMRLVSADVDRYGPLAACHPPCDEAVTVLAGPNESGKTLYLEGLLQLLEPDVSSEMKPGPRVDESPAGRVVVDDGTDRHVLGTDTHLSDVSRIEPNHLYTLFVIRDSDLVLPDGTSYYTSLVEHLGDIHTSEIAAIREGLVTEGRLTPKNLNLANQEYDTKEVSSAVETLASEIDDYLETAKAHGVESLSRERFDLQTDLQRVSDRLATQRTAESLAAIEDLDDQLSVYTKTTEQIDAAAVDGDTLSKLREWEAKRSHRLERVNEIESTLETKRGERRRYQNELETAWDRYAELEQREQAIERVETALDGYREETAGIDPDGDVNGLDARLGQLRAVTAAGLVGAGIAGGSSALTGSVQAAIVGIVLFGAAIVAWLFHHRLTTAANRAATSERELLRNARDAGFEVERPSAIAPLVRGYRDEFAGTDSRITELQTTVDKLGDDIASLDSKLHEKRDNTDRLDDDITSVLTEAGVESIDEYADRVENLEDRYGRRDRASTVLEREIGDHDSDNSYEKVAFWEEHLRKRRSEIGETAIDPDQFNAAELKRLEERHATIKSELEGVESELGDHRQKLEAFERRANDISPPPFVETTPSLQARTIDGLRTLADDLRTIRETILRNAETSSKAIEILDDIADDETQKISTLFDPDGPASARFSRLTDGRYSAVEYDPDAGTLEVQTGDGRSYTPDQLSYGTRDQLYFAARLSLAEQLLDGTAGFLLLDDPFLAADPNRLQNGIEILGDLADEGWQIIYLTAKPAVRDRLADHVDCDLYDMEPLEP